LTRFWLSVVSDDEIRWVGGLRPTHDQVHVMDGAPGHLGIQAFG